MARFDPRRLTPAEKERLVDALASALGRLRDRRSLRAFVLHFFSASELAMFGRRILVARALLRGETYKEIRTKLGVGLSTVQFMDARLRVLARQYRYADMGKRWKRGQRAQLKEMEAAMAEERRWLGNRRVFLPLLRGLGLDIFPY